MSSSHAAMAAQCERYVQKHDVVLSPLEFERDHSIPPETLFPQLSRRKSSMMLHDNYQHLHFVRHLPTGIRMAFCYKSRLVKAKADRLLSLLKARLPSDYSYIKLLKPQSYTHSPELSAFYDYLPRFLVAGPGESKRTKANRESFSSFFLLFTTATSSHPAVAVAATSPPSTPTSPATWILSRSSSPSTGDEAFGSFLWLQQQQQQQQQQEQQEQQEQDLLPEPGDLTQEPSQLEPMDFIINQESVNVHLDFGFKSETVGEDEEHLLKGEEDLFEDCHENSNKDWWNSPVQPGAQINLEHRRSQILEEIVNFLDD